MQKGKSKNGRRYNRQDIPIMSSPLFHEVDIRPAERVRCVVLPDSEGMNPPDYVAELSTYTLRFPIDPTASAKDREHLRSTLQRRAIDLYRAAEFFPYLSDDQRYRFEIQDLLPVTLTRETPPAIELRGVTLDMMFELTRLGILASNLTVAHAFKKASQDEYRGPLMTSGVEYEMPAADVYQRSKLNLRSEDAIGDLGIPDDTHAYQHAVQSLKQGLARGHFPNQEAFERAVKFVAFVTLKGLLPSPYPTEQTLLGDGSYPDTDASRKQMVRDRIDKILPEVLGDGKGGFDEQAMRLKSEELERIKNDDIPTWYVGNKQDWRAHLDKNFAEAKVFARQEMERYENTSFPDLLNSLADETKRRKDAIKSTLERGQSNRSLRLPEEPLALDWQALSFFGVTHRFDSDRGTHKEIIYSSRNPLIDPPRDIPLPLQALLDKETAERSKIGR